MVYFKFHSFSKHFKCYMITKLKNVFLNFCFLYSLKFLTTNIILIYVSFGSLKNRIMLDFFICYRVNVFFLINMHAEKELIFI